MNLTYQDIISTIGLCFNSLACLLNFIVVIGVIAAFLQVRAARESIRAQSLLKLIEDWKNPQVYRSVRYVDSLRQQWKQRPSKEWYELAKEWVENHVGKDPQSTDSRERELAEEWMLRRTASQFLSKLGLLIENGSLHEDDLFGVDPEVGRQLSVLIPIEVAIQSYWAEKEQNPIAIWDKPVAKWEFNALWTRYQSWYRKKSSKLHLDPIDLSKL